MLAVWIVALGLATSSSAQDALICRKRDSFGDNQGRVYRLGRGNDYFNAGPGLDVIYGGPGNDIINGGRGNDRVYGGPGHDISCGGVGRDSVDGDAGRDEAYGEEGDDTVSGGPGRDVIKGQAGSDLLIGFGRTRNGTAIADGIDYLESSYRADVIIVGGRDVAFGGEGHDRIASATNGIGARLLDGGLDNDRIRGTAAADNLIAGGAGEDVLSGSGGADEISGGPAEDSIFGGEGDDRLFGDGKLDALSGGPDTDYCDGGNGGAITDGTCETQVDAVQCPPHCEPPPTGPLRSVGGLLREWAQAHSAARGVRYVGDTDQRTREIVLTLDERGIVRRAEIEWVANCGRDRPIRKRTLVTDFGRSSNGGFAAAKVEQGKRGGVSYRTRYAVVGKREAKHTMRGTFRFSGRYRREGEGSKTCRTGRVHWFAQISRGSPSSSTPLPENR